MPVEVKICGIDRNAAMATALDAGADYVGLVFYEPSPRHLDFDRAARLAGQARGKSKIVALTVDAGDDLLDQIITKIAPDYIQLHGAETPQRVKQIAQGSGCATIKAIKVARLEDVAAAKAYDGSADMILFDAKAPKDMADALPGGNGLVFDWRLLENVPAEPAYMLCGGLKADNVRTAIDLTRAPIVDVSSGVEQSPGMKDTAAIRKFIAAAKSAS